MTTNPANDLLGKSEDSFDINDIINSIDIDSDPNSRYYGRLVKWKSGDEWRYGIGLSNETIFDTKNLDIKGRNKREGDGFSIFIVKPYRSNFSQSEIIDRLKYTLLSIKGNNQGNCDKRETWNGEYDEDNWNDEHLSRFIANNEAISYKKRFEGDKKKYQKLKLFIKENNPDLFLNVNIKNPVIKKIIRFFKRIPRLFYYARFWVFSFTVILAIILAIFKYYWIVLVLFSLVFVLSKLLEYEWSGLQNKNLWDWLSLLFVPIILATGGFYLQQQNEERQKNSDETKAQQQALIEYFKNVKDIVKFQTQLEKNENKLENSKSEGSNSIKPEKYLTEENKKLVESFTRIVLPQISGYQKRQVIQFLYGLELIKCKDICYKNSEKNTKNLLALNEADFSKAELNDMDLKNLYLPNVNLKGADFTISILDGANLTNSNLEDYQDKKFSLALASIKSVNFGKSKFTSKMEEKKWIQVQLLQSLLPLEKDKSLPPCDFYKTEDTQKSDYKDYSGQDISEAKLERIDLRNFNFEKANLSKTSLKQSFLGRANLKNAKLKDVNLEGAYLKDVTIDEASKRNLDSKTQLIINILNFPKEYIDELKNFKNKDLSNSDLSTIEIKNNSEKDMKHINLRDSKLNCSILENIDMSGDSDLSGAELSNAELTNINFSGANLASADLKDTIMNNVNLSNAVLFAADLSNATIKGDKGDMQGANLNSAILKGADLSEAKNLDKVVDFTGATYDEKTKFPKNFKYKNTVLGLFNAKN